MKTCYTAYYPSPLGSFAITCNANSVVRAYFLDPEQDLFSNLPSSLALIDHGAPPILKQALSQISQYFKGTRKDFDLPLDLSGPPFYLKVWQELMNIPFGATVSYGAIAKSVGNERACRAVGMANNRNPVSIIVPCHRVIGSNGQLVGYGGGLDRKEWLLAWEKKVVSDEKKCLPL